MPKESRDPHPIQSELEATEEYQAPPRQREQDGEVEQPPTGAGNEVDVSLLEAQQGREKTDMSETKPAGAASPNLTVSGKDELVEPQHPRATPPGERM